VTTPRIPSGETASEGAFRIDSWIGGDRLLGTSVHDGRRVHVTHLRESAASLRQLHTLLMYDVPEVAKCLFVGGLDGPNSDHLVMIEELPSGRSLIHNHHLGELQCLDVSLQLARLVSSAAAHQVVLAGLVPELVFLDASLRVGLVPRPRTFLATAPRNRKVLDGHWGTPTFDYNIGPFLDASRLDVLLADTSTDVYELGLLIAWIYERKHPYSNAGEHPGDRLYAMQSDERDPFTGPPAIGQLLDGVLLADPTRRLPPHEVVSRLQSMSSAR
jgi:hypothetical protein